jgi:hypothetical protein
VTTYRVATRRRFTSVDRRMVGDSRLSFRARGVLVWILDKPDGWRFTADDLAHHGTEGRDAMRTALGELRTLGYIVLERSRRPDGTWQSAYEVHEFPPESSDTSGLSKADNQRWLPDVGFPGRIETTETEDCDQEVVEADLADSDRDARQGRYGNRYDNFRVPELWASRDKLHGGDDG